MKLNDSLKGWACAALFIAVIFGGMYLIEGPEGQYLITEKKDGKIVYRDLYGTNKHTMIFDMDMQTMGFDVYSNIKVGDTISGLERNMKQPVTKSWYWMEGQNYAKHNTIRTINGTDIRALKLQKHRDELLREMSQRHR